MCFTLVGAQMSAGVPALSHAMTQPVIGQRSDALIFLIDGLEAYNSLQREDDQEKGGKRSSGKHRERAVEHDLNT